MSATTITFINAPAFAPASGAFLVDAAAAVRSFFARAKAALAQSAESRERAYEEAYLSESVDRYDLEFRMRELARANPQPYWMTGLGR
ncbi:hypothetical protein ACFDR9_001839 [Janthinobacterium sp. CG_23.3]|uniref:DUF3563 family protein n=1 Tax=Janthinobacterium sp. CG_23.3 TaxID=3349634 RepID=UPI0038D38FE5